MAHEIGPGPTNTVRHATDQMRAVNAARMLLDDLKRGTASSVVTKGLLERFNEHAAKVDPSYEAVEFGDLGTDKGRAALDRFAAMPLA